MSGASSASRADKIKFNKENVGKYDPLKVRLLQDRLDDRQKDRLESLLDDIEQNWDEIMKEKAEYAKQGMKADTKSQMSRVSDATSNAFVYTEVDTKRMAEINERLQKMNPGLVGSQMTSDHVSEASGDKSGLNKQKLKNLGGFDDNRSILSMGSNLTGFSRKSAVSMLNMDSITSNDLPKKMPGSKGLAENAKRRMEKAKMASIEMNLKKI
jgi:hypothetical protein